MNLYKKNILKHVMPMNPRRHHKYLYIDANGNYVYPEDVAKKAGNKAKALNAQGQANAVNMRKARAESVKVGNSRMAAKLKGIYDQGQVNNINARKTRAESINAGNERVANSKAYKVGKTILEESTAGRKIKRFNKHANDLARVVDDINVPKGNKVKPKRKTPEEIAREDAELERSISEKMSEFAAHKAEEYYKDQAKKKSEQLPKGWSRDQNGLVYDELGAIALDPNDPNLKKKKKRVKKNVAKAIRTSVAHSDTYRSNVMNSHQRKIYSSQIKHGLEWKKHKYLYKDANGNYVYPEDVKNKAAGAVSNIKNGASKAINAKKDEMRLIGNAHNRPMSYGALDREKTKWDYAHATREWANDDRREADKYRNGEYFIRGNNSYDTKKQFASEKARAIGDAHASEERAKQANSEANRFMEGNIKRNAANPLKRMAADAFVKYEHKRNVKKNKKWKEEHADELAANRKKEEAADERHAAAIRKEWALKDQRERGRDQEMERSNRASKVRKEAKANERRRTSEAQRKSAHAGYADWKNDNDMSYREYLEKMTDPEYAKKEANKKKKGIFTDTTKELERQKEKTAARKTKARTEAGVEAGRDRIKKKKKKPTVKGSKKVTTWDNAKIKKW